MQPQGESAGGADVENPEPGATRKLVPRAVAFVDRERATDAVAQDLVARVLRAPRIRGGDRTAIGSGQHDLRHATERQPRRGGRSQRGLTRERRSGARIVDRHGLGRR
jgi:hypothetical protein